MKIESGPNAALFASGSLLYTRRCAILYKISKKLRHIALLPRCLLESLTNFYYYCRRRQLLSVRRKK